MVGLSSESLCPALFAKPLVSGLAWETWVENLGGQALPHDCSGGDETDTAEALSQ